MAIVGTHEDSEGGSGDLEGFTTAFSISPAADELWLVSVKIRNPTGDWTDDPTLTGGGMSAWTLTTKCLRRGQSTFQVFVFRATDASPGSGTLTFDGPGTDDFDVWSIIADSFTGTALTGTNGADAIVQTQDETTFSGNVVTATYDSGFESGSAGYAAFAYDGGGVTTDPKSGWTELGEEPVSGQLGHETQWIDGSDTTAEADFGAAAFNGHGVAIELAAAAAAAGGSLPPLRQAHMKRSPLLRM